MERIWAVDFTSGGAPIGLTEEEMRAAQAHDETRRAPLPPPARSIARQALLAAAQVWAPQATPKIEQLKHFGEGVDREAFAAWVEFSGADRDLSGSCVALVPRPFADAECDARARREATLLPRLAALGLPLRVPRRAVAVEVSGRAVLVREALSGIPLDLRAGRQGALRPWEVVARAAACVHAADPGPLLDLLGGAKTRRAHAMECLRALDALPAPEAKAARAWAVEHLPPETPGTLLHGDLLGQNLLLGLDEPDALIDWEHAAVGDPAYDLAIVTRGARQPFQTPDGMGKLLDAYTAAGAPPLRRCEVRLYELYLSAREYEQALDEGDPGLTHEALARLRRVLQQARVDTRK